MKRITLAYFKYVILPLSCPVNQSSASPLSMNNSFSAPVKSRKGKGKSFTTSYVFTHSQRKSRVYFNNNLYCTHQMPAHRSMMPSVHHSASLPALLHSSTIVCFLSFPSVSWLKEADGVKTRIQCFLCWP